MHSRSVELSSERLGLIAKMDLVEGGAGVVSPVDYKKGAPRDGDEGPDAWPADRVQVCVQALILRDSGYTCDEAVLYYSATKQRVRIVIDAANLLMMIRLRRTGITGHTRDDENRHFPPRRSVAGDRCLRPRAEDDAQRPVGSSGS